MGCRVVGERKTTSKAAYRVTINSLATLSACIAELYAKFREHKYLVLSVRPGKDRSLDQNALWQKMYERVAVSTGQGTQKEVWADCKLLLGVPILRRDDERFAAGWDRYFSDKSYGEQLFLMGANPLFGPDGFPVTRLFGTAQGREYTEAIADQYARLGVHFGDLLSGGEA